MECLIELTTSVDHKRVTKIWVLGQKEIEGNEKIDQ